MPRKIRELKADYSMVLQWEPEGKVFVVTVPELPGCRTHGSTYEEAVRQAHDAIATWIDGAREDGDPVPEPIFFPVHTARSWRGHAGSHPRSSHATAVYRSG
jgi:predicted RNase H-like HicB family nuclease